MNWCCPKAGYKNGSLKLDLFQTKIKKRCFSKKMSFSAWNLHQCCNIAIYFLNSCMNYVYVFIISLHLWLLLLCIQYDVQEMSQIIISKMNQPRIQILYIHYALIKRLCVCKDLYTELCLFFSSYGCTVRCLPRFSGLCRLPLLLLWAHTNRELHASGLYGRYLSSAMSVWSSG